MTDQYLASGLRAWLQGTEARPDDARRSTDKVMARVDKAGQRGRWWPLPAFDRAASTLLSRELASAPIPATYERQPAIGFTMFSAVKFVVAGVIVALFGGFLLAGVITTQQGDEVVPAAVTESPSPMTTEEFLSTMVTDEVEPGVYRVVNDGVRDLASVEAVDIVAGYDDGIWLLRKDEFLRLGSGETHQWPRLRAGGRVFEVAPDGTMWVIAADGTKWVIAGRGYVEYPERRGREGYYSTDSEEWTVEPCPRGCHGLTVAPDGTVWATWLEEDGRRVGHLGPAGWQPLDGYFRSGRGAGIYPERLLFSDAGDVYGVDYYFGTLYRHENGDWQHVVDGRLVDVGRDGTVWQAKGPDNDASFPYNDLARFADGEWTRWSSADLPDVRLGLDYEFEVAPDGSLWFSLWRSADGEPPGGDWWLAVRDGHLVCDGLARFDGETLDRFVPGRCISMDIAAVGSVWVLADKEKGKDLYVITPDAVASTE